jgi:CDP-glucose 4,6-dehydratase
VEGLAVTAAPTQLPPLPDPAFWRGRRVLLTGHTGFKGAWAALWLERLGAEVTGVALEPETEPSLFALAAPKLRSHIANIRDATRLAQLCTAAEPQIVIHMAAQALVRRGYAEPRATFETNVQGTANLLDALGHCDGVETVLVVTSDKCYRNDNSGRAFTEADPLGGADPYSASKAAQDMVAHGWRSLSPMTVATARAGNVFGGGDWAADRVLPDLFRAAARGEAVRLRNPHATRPWQHVLDVLAGYLVYIERLTAASPTDRSALPTAMNFGPPPRQVHNVAWLVETAIAALRAEGVDAADWQQDGVPGPAEAATLTLDPTLAKATLGWRMRLAPEDAVAWTAAWHARLKRGEPARDLSLGQIDRFAGGEAPA